VLQILWIAINFYIHLGWEMSLLFWFDYMQWPSGWAPYNSFVHAFYAYGDYDSRYRVEPATYYGSNIDKVVLAVEVPAGMIDGVLCIIWLYAMLTNKWYRHPVQLTVSALHAFGTVVFWADEFVVGWMMWMKGNGWVWTNTAGPSSFGFWWAFIGTNLVWVVVPLMCCKHSMNEMQKKLDVTAEGHQKSM